MEQNNYIERKNCPACGSGESQLFLEVPDFRMSRDVFPIHRCSACGLNYTKLVPTADNIGSFYKSDSYDSHRLDNQSWISRAYRIVRNINVKSKVYWVKRYLKTGLVVDYGCGLGHFVKGLSDAGFEAKGFEIDADVRGLSKIELGIELESLDAFHMLPPNSVDLISMWHVLEHVYDLNKDFTSLLDKLKYGGYLFVAVPNVQSFDAKYYGPYWEAYDVPRHLYHFNRSRLISFCEAFALCHEETIPMKFDGYYVSLRSEKNKVKGSSWNGLRIGFLSNFRAGEYGFSSHVFVFRKT